jgi:phage protein U
VEVGTFGDISFYVKRKSGKLKMLSFSDVETSSSAQFEEHERNGKKAYLEFIAPGLEQLSLEIYASAQYGVKPLSIKKKLDKYRKNGTPKYFVMGGKKIGDSRWVITDMSSRVSVIYTNGRPQAIQFSLTLKEYANPKQKKKKTSKKAASAAKTGKTSGGSSVKKKSYTVYTIKKGDTLWGLAKKYYGAGIKYMKIYNANKKAASGFNRITDPNKLQIGWVIKIPK